jgi:hypothetical protein
MKRYPRTRELDTTPLNLERFHGHAQHLTVYVITRHYGGPEEGGWWYNMLTPVFSTGKVPARKLNQVRDRMFRRFGHLQHGDISSVLGGEEINIIAERTPGQHTTRRHPKYS